MSNVYIGLLLESILFALLAFVIHYGEQTVETVCLTGISSPGSWVEFLYFVRSNLWVKCNTALLCCL